MPLPNLHIANICKLGKGISSNIEADRAGFLRGRKGALINIHTNEGAQGC